MKKKQSIKKIMAQFFISTKQSRIENNRSFYGCFWLGPFDSEQSLTVANALRRTLLSELKGIAIISVEIEGGVHEYATIPGVRDSILDILLNLKEIVLSRTGKTISPAYVASVLHPNWLSKPIVGEGKEEIRFKPQIGYLRVRGPGIVRASDLKLPSLIKCVDPQQYIATLADNGVLNMKFYIAEGKNYTIQKPNVTINFSVNLAHYLPSNSSIEFSQQQKIVLPLHHTSNPEGKIHTKGFRILYRSPINRFDTEGKKGGSLPSSYLRYQSDVLIDNPSKQNTSLSQIIPFHSLVDDRAMFSSKGSKASTSLLSHTPSYAPHLKIFFDKMEAIPKTPIWVNKHLLLETFKELYSTKLIKKTFVSEKNKKTTKLANIKQKKSLHTNPILFMKEQNNRSLLFPSLYKEGKHSSLLPTFAVASSSLVFSSLPIVEEEEDRASIAGKKGFASMANPEGRSRAIFIYPKGKKRRRSLTQRVSFAFIDTKGKERRQSLTQRVSFALLCDGVTRSHTTTTKGRTVKQAMWLCHKALLLSIPNPFTPLGVKRGVKPLKGKSEDYPLGVTWKGFKSFSPLSRNRRKEDIARQIVAIPRSGTTTRSLSKKLKTKYSHNSRLTINHSQSLNLNLQKKQNFVFNGLIPFENPLNVDAIFSPINKVNYIIEVNQHKMVQNAFLQSYSSLFHSFLLPSRLSNSAILWYPTQRVGSSHTTKGKHLPGKDFIDRETLLPSGLEHDRKDFTIRHLEKNSDGQKENRIPKMLMPKLKRDDKVLLTNKIEDLISFMSLTSNFRLLQHLYNWPNPTLWVKDDSKNTNKSFAVLWNQQKPILFPISPLIKETVTRTKKWNKQYLLSKEPENSMVQIIEEEEENLFSFIAKGNERSEYLWSETTQRSTSLLPLEDLEDRAQFELDKSKHNIILEVWTNGSIHPRQAVYIAFKNLVRLFAHLQKIMVIDKIYQSPRTYQKSLQKIKTETFGWNKGIVINEKQFLSSI